MKKIITKLVRLLVLLCGLGLTLYMIWQLMSGTQMLNFNLQTQGPLIVVVFSILLLLTLGTAISFFANQHLAATIYLAAVLTVMAFILWLRHPEQANIYRLYFIYGLLVVLLSPLLLKKQKK